MNRTMQVTTDKYIVKGYGIEFYCKVTKITVQDSTSITVSFGGPYTFCVVISIESDKQYIPYIDRVEYNEKCIKDGILDEFGGTALLVKCALWTILHLYPTIPRLTLTDDSHINCKRGVRRYKMSLSYDSILKRDKTWYETKFGATLPTDLLKSYKNSLSCLESKLTPFEIVVQKFPAISKFKLEYMGSNTPREFINAIRKNYKETYCYEVGEWLSQYMEYLGVKYYKQDWYIDASSIEKPDAYELLPTNINMRGGTWGKRNKTRKVNMAYVGSYGSFDY